MLDINRIENNFDEVCQLLNSRQTDYTNDLKTLIKLNNERKTIIKKVEDLKAQKNKFSKEIGEFARNGNTKEVEKTKKEVEKTAVTIEKLDGDLKIINQKFNELALTIPNIPNKNIPIGKDEEENKFVRAWKENDLKNKSEAHWDIATKLNLVDFELGVKLSGSRFLVYKENGAIMLRAIADILLTRHKKYGYKEMNLPLLVNQEIMIGTGQLPKFEDDAYRIDNQYLIPTSEVSLTNTVRNEILDESILPLYLTAFSQCFRRESGSAGRDTKGMIRVHQFNKVEMVKICKPDDSDNELEALVKDAEDCLQMFDLPYRVVELCSGDIGFSAQKTYDLEVWFPNQNKYREISSCSNCGDFQARRMMSRFKNKENKTEYIHTLNGSGLAIERLFAAILENHYDGKKLNLPKVLQPYFNNEEYLK